ncbi:hypothetical protein G7046_g7507 [Stylonectria norvegica]|nr:hypothetical protein G7046_g7507 [Stylonectria norvegica]
MPEIAEVARVVHFLRLHLIGKRISTASALDDQNVFGKVGTTGADVQATLIGKKIISAGSQGKYFWITLEKPPHLVMHLGMTGWVHIKGETTAYTNYYKKMKDEEKDHWPPKFTKFSFATEGTPAVEVAFADARRFGRVRLVDCPGEDIRKHSPLKENGPDPVVDTDVFTEDYLKAKMRARRVPVKALLLDQTTISGIGNWVADETLYQAKFHPEQYCNEFDDAQVAKLYEAIRYVCQTAVDKLGDSDQFPEDWLFNHRWGKGTKGEAAKLPNGDKLAFITVGGRTSCYAPGVQKKTGRTTDGIKEEPLVNGTKDKAPKKAKATKKSQKALTESGDEDSPPPKKAKGPKKSRRAPIESGDEESPPPKRKRAKPTKKGDKGQVVKMEEKVSETKPEDGLYHFSYLKLLESRERWKYAANISTISQPDTARDSMFAQDIVFDALDPSLNKNSAEAGVTIMSSIEALILPQDPASCNAISLLASTSPTKHLARTITITHKTTFQDVARRTEGVLTPALYGRDPRAKSRASVSANAARMIAQHPTNAPATGFAAAARPLRFSREAPAPLEANGISSPGCEFVHGC